MARRYNTGALRNIKQIVCHSRRTFGYQVCLTRRGRRFTRFFNGLEPASLAAAMRHRDGLLAKLGGPDFNCWRRREVRSRKSEV